MLDFKVSLCSQSHKVFNMVRMLTPNQVALSQSRVQGTAFIVTLKTKSVVGSRRGEKLDSLQIWEIVDEKTGDSWSN